MTEYAQGHEDITKQAQEPRAEGELDIPFEIFEVTAGGGESYIYHATVDGHSKMFRIHDRRYEPGFYIRCRQCGDTPPSSSYASVGLAQDGLGRILRYPLMLGHRDCWDKWMADRGYTDEAV